MQPTFYVDSPASLYCSHRTSNCSGCSSCSQCTAIPNLPLHLSNQLLPLPSLPPSLLHRFDEKYRQVVALVNGGATLNDAKEVVGLKRSTFRRWRLVAGLLNLVNRISRATLQDCETQSKTILQRASSHNRMEELLRAGVCLKTNAYPEVLNSRLVFIALLIRFLLKLNQPTEVSCTIRDGKIV